MALDMEIDERYQNAYVYRIFSDYTENEYIGSSIYEPLERLRKHKVDKKRYEEGKRRYITSFNILQYEDARIEVIELYPCNNKKELEKREGEIIKQCPNAINKQIAGRTIEEYRHDNKEARKVFDKLYYETHKEKHLKQTKEYYLKNKSDILAKHSEVHLCQCGVSYTKGHKSRHNNSIRHKEWETVEYIKQDFPKLQSIYNKIVFGK